MEEREVEDIVTNLEKKKSRKKGIKSGAKGNRGEREVCDIFNNRFMPLLTENIDWGRFVRASGSGALGHRRLSSAGRATYIGDIACPDNFKFVLECKLGYDDIDIDLFSICFYDGVAGLEEFLGQVQDDAKRSKKRKPLLLWRKNRKKHLAFLKTKDLPDCDYEYSLKYKDWTAIPLAKLLEEPDEYFFELD